MHASCAACGAALPPGAAAEHAASHCPRRTVRCLHSDGAGGCAWRGARDALAAHLLHACPAAPAACALVGACVIVAATCACADVM
jgi:hypothetical protein